MSYTGASIQVLDGIEHVRKRPAMYIGGTGVDGYHHLLWEIVDNATDEAMNGFADTIHVTLDADAESVAVEDNGRGIPVDEVPDLNISALEVVLTQLNAGGKFSNSNYKTSGGLHGVGASVVNALSSSLIATVRRDGHEYQQEYRRGRAKADVHEIGRARGTGTTIWFSPDPEVFDEPGFDSSRIADQLEIKSYLHKGVRFVFKDQPQKRTIELKHDGGLSDYLTSLVSKRETPEVIEQRFCIEREAEGMYIDVAISWTDHNREKLLSYVNGIPTKDGGTHESGLRDAIVKALRSFLDTHQLTPRGITLTSDDLREGLLGVISLRIANPQFQSQTKTRLNNPEVKGFVDSTVRPLFEGWLHSNRSVGETIIVRAIQAAKARIAMKQAASKVRRKSVAGTKLNLPGKLADCSSSNPNECELFIVEGDSAGGSAKQGRDRRVQAVLPLRGKVLNAEQATIEKLLKNVELNNVVTALGCGMGADFRENRLRYQRIILLMDADSDGHHITTLMLAFFYRFLRPLIQKGYVYLGLPPLYRINVGKKTHWALDDADRDRFLNSLPARAKPEITRFKGLGEMPPKTLFQTTLDPKTRRLEQVTLDEPILAEQMITDLMGSDPSIRRKFILELAPTATNLDV